LYSFFHKKKQLLDMANNVCVLNDNISVDLTVDMCSGGSKKVTLTASNYTSQARNETPVFEFPPFSLTKQASAEQVATSNKKQKKKGSSNKGNEVSEINDNSLLNVRGVVLNARSKKEELEPYDLSSAVLCGTIKPVNRVEKMDCRLFDSDLGATSG
jgi:hypothetical protein